MNSLKARTPLLFFLALLLITAVYYSLVYLPMQDQIKAIQQQRTAAQDQLTLYTTYASDVGTLKNDVARLRNDIDGALAVKYSVNSHNLPEDLQAAIKASGVTLQGLQVNTPQVINSTGNFNINQLPTSVRFQCANIGQAFALLNYFEQSSNSYYYVSKISTDDVMKSFGVQLDLLLYYPEAAGTAQ